MKNIKLQNEVSSLLQDYQKETQSLRDNLRLRAKKTHKFMETEHITLSEFLAYCQAELSKDDNNLINLCDLTAPNYILGIVDSVFFYRQVVADWSVKSYEWDDESLYSFAKAMDPKVLQDDLY